MRRRAPHLLLSLVLFAGLLSLPGSSTAGGGPNAPDVGRSPRGADPFRPDLWIKLCGLSTGCTINPLPHPWLGNDVYNRNGRRQTVAVRIDDGEGVRFWLTLQNDGTDADTFTVKGCRGNSHFVVNAVLVGLYKRPSAAAVKITKRFKEGTATFDFPASPKRVHLTVNIVTTSPPAFTYKCPIRIISQGDSTLIDTVVAKMTTF
jgi:hypothetical protein